MQAWIAQLHCFFELALYLLVLSFFFVGCSDILVIVSSYVGSDIIWGKTGEKSYHLALSAKYAVHSHQKSTLVLSTQQ